MAAKGGMTKAQMVTVLASKTRLTKKQVNGLLGALTALAYKEAKNGFTIPGQAGAGQPQGPHGPQPRHGRAHQDPGQEGAEVPGRQGGQGRRHRRKEIALTSCA